MFERFTTEARMAVVAAQEEARNAGAKRIEAFHLLIGAVDSAPVELRDELTAAGLTAAALRNTSAGRVLTENDAAALRGLGIDLNAIATAVSDRFGVDILRPIRGRFGTGNIPFGDGSKKALKAALRTAADRKDRSISGAHVILGILDSGDAEATAAIEAIVGTPELKARLHTVLVKRAA